MPSLLPSLSADFLIYNYFAAINLITFGLYGFDKLSSQTKAWRISEKTLLIMALAGGSLGALTAMKIFRHKTKKLSFQGLLALVLIAQVAILLYLLSPFTISLGQARP